MKIWNWLRKTLQKPFAAELPERFRTLVVHFFERFFDKDSLTPDADERANVVQLVAMLALPGAILSLFMIFDHPLIRSELTRQWLRSGDRYVFICYAMTVMGFVMTFKWDSLFPDRRDYLILTTLPISLREFFAAKVISLCGFLLLFGIAINVFSSVMVPYAFVVRDNKWSIFFPALIAHASAVLGASIFTALFFAGLQGVLINLMSPSMFRRISPWIQMVSMTILVTILLITPGISANMQLLAESKSRVLDFIPLFWFQGIYEVLNPEGTLIGSSTIWARTAVEAMLAAGLVFLLTYLVSYRRYSKKILEGVESETFLQPWHERAAASLLNVLLLRHAFQRASFYFIGKIFGRSAKHRLFIAMYSGIGLALILSSLFVLRRDSHLTLAISRTGLLEAPLILSFFVVSGLRATFNLPYELGANWMFQITSGYGAGEYLAATRRWVLLRGVIPMYLVLVPLEFYFLNPVEAAFRLLFGLAVAALLTEALFFNFNKVPFTCSYLPAKSHLAFLGGAYLYGFTIYTSMMADLERWVGQSWGRIGMFFAEVIVTLILISLYRRQTRDRLIGLVYEDDRDPLVRQLNLT
ncbi:MAG TPA: hypothetical protein VGK48_25100 [Terriglobia bacterium]|jgi:hypothetical protein